jgi:response regulator of citrate/malate metabolism
MDCFSLAVEKRRDMLINVMITEDDLLSAAMLCDLLEDHFPFVRIVRKTQTVRDSVAFLRDNKIDLLFLDIELPDGNGFDILAGRETIDFEVIVTTSFRNYQGKVPAKKVLASIIKPVTSESLGVAMNAFMDETMKTDPAKERS